MHGKAEKAMIVAALAAAALLAGCGGSSDSTVPAQTEEAPPVSQAQPPTQPPSAQSEQRKPESSTAKQGGEGASPKAGKKDSHPEIVVNTRGGVAAEIIAKVLNERGKSKSGGKEKHSQLQSILDKLTEQNGGSAAADRSSAAKGAPGSTTSQIERILREAKGE